MRVSAAVRRYSRSLPLIAVLLLPLIISCGPKPELEGTVAGVAPSDLKAKPFHQRVNLVWKTNRDGSTPILGYNVYLSNTPVLGTSDEAALRASLKPYSDQPYPGDTDPSFEYETLALENLINGQSYYLFVTTVYPGGVESAPSNQVEVVPRPQGDFHLKRSFSGAGTGYSLKKLKSVHTDDLENDIYLTVIDNSLHVASPNRIDDVLRKTEFYSTGKFDDLNRVKVTELTSQPDDVLQLHNREVFVIRDADGCYALLRVEKMDARAKEAQFSFIYQAKPNTLIF